MTWRDVVELAYLALGSSIVVVMWRVLRVLERVEVLEESQPLGSDRGGGLPRPEKSSGGEAPRFPANVVGIDDV